MKNVQCRKMLFGAVLLVAPITALALPAEYPHKISSEDAKSGQALQHSDAQTAVYGGVSTINRELLVTQDGKMSIGLYRMADGAFDVTENGYALNELVVMVSGKLRLEGVDGKVTELLPGDALTITKGWKGKWRSVGESTYYYAVNQ